MVTIKPNTPEADQALLQHAAGGKAIRKGGLYIQAEREAAARSKGFKTWQEYDEHRGKETAAWWEALMGGRLAP